MHNGEVAIRETDFDLPGQVGEVYRGKVGDVYTIASPEHGDLLAVVRTDRISAFDTVLPELIPYKGQVLNQMSATLLGATVDAAPNWLIETPDPNVSVGYRAEPFKVEMIMRGYLLGSSWAGYREGNRDLCGIRLPEGMHEFQPFAEPLITPTTKADAGHDQNITPTEIVESGLATADEYDEIARLSKTLFARGQEVAAAKGLLLADTKYEFGRLATGQIVVIDEAHTPDSSRYFPADQFAAYLDNPRNDRPSQLSKEFVREWLKAHGFQGEPGQSVPDMSLDFVAQVSARYRNLYERMLGESFEPATAENEAVRLDAMRQGITDFLARV